MELDGKFDVDNINQTEQHAIAAQIEANKKHIERWGASRLKQKGKQAIVIVLSVARLENAARITRSKQASVNLCNLFMVAWLFAHVVGSVFVLCTTGTC